MKMKRTWIRMLPFAVAAALFAGQAAAEGVDAKAARATANVVDFLALAHDTVASNVEHAGIVLVPSGFRGNEFDAIANAVVLVASQCPKGLEGLVVYLRRSP